MSKKTPRGLSVFWIILTILVAIGAGLGGARWMTEQSLKATARATIIWISIDGLRGDYVRRGDLPFFRRLKQEARTTEKLRPAFPSTTFPSHCAQATGVTADRHGVTGNSFYDTATGLLYNHPNDAALLQAEPIWLTAQRQGVHTAVYDWPLSFVQRGRVRTDHFLDGFDPTVSDSKRLERLLLDWKNAIEKPNAVALHLLMGYLVATDRPGHLFGPDSPEILQEMVGLDSALADFTARAIQIWKQQRHSPKDRLFFIFSTDHGMSPLRYIVGMDRLLGLSRTDPDYHLTTTGNVGHVFLDSDKYPANGDSRELKLRELSQRVVQALPTAMVYLRSALPKSFGYAHPTRTGDLVIILPVGYAFGAPTGTEVVADATSRGMHGYDVDTDPEMLGFLAIWEPSRPVAADLGVVSWDQLHPTVAKMLGVEPATAADGKPVQIGGLD